MSSVDREKLDDLFLKLRSLGDKVKATRAQIGEPLMDRILSRATKTLTRFGNGNGVQQQPQQQPEPPGRICPKCGVPAAQEARFCSRCAFDFEAQESSERRRREEEEKLERFSKMGVVP